MQDAVHVGRTVLNWVHGRVLFIEVNNRLSKDIEVQECQGDGVRE